ncbi:MAG: hypothetical protein KGI54_17025 [Pseudomonadota bacterium]|nr:hypothetical protein [Pseudomonadota bacterium]
MKVKTYDILNAGPKNRFMANGRIVSNSSTGAQLQNLTRPKIIKDANALVDRILEENMSPEQIKAEIGPTMVVVSEMIRPVFIAKPDHWIARGDYSAIEARFLPFLAGHDKLLQAYRDYDAGIGKDLYVVTASMMFNKPMEAITPEERTAGKVCVLAFGYQGGAKAFLRFAKIYGVHVSEEKAESYKNAWREANPEIVQLWKDIQNAAIECLQTAPGHLIYARPNLSFKRNSKTMIMRLPSGRPIFFWYPSVKKVETQYGPKNSMFYYTEDISRKWVEQPAYGGMLTALAVQGSSTRDIIANAMLNAEADNLNPIMAVHDEIICELPKSRFPSKEEAALAVKNTMLKKAPWFEALPLNVDATAGLRYGK